MMDIEEVEHLKVLKKDLSAEEQMDFDNQFVTRRKDPIAVLLLSIFIGELGVDRFYLGYTGLGFCKLLSLGGLFIWWFIDLFLMMGVTKRKNMEIANQIHEQSSRQGNKSGE